MFSVFFYFCIFSQKFGPAPDGLGSSDQGWHYYCKDLKKFDTWKIAEIILKFEQCCSTIYIQNTQTEWQTMSTQIRLCLLGLHCLPRPDALTNVFPPEGDGWEVWRDYPRELDNFENLGIIPNTCGTILCPKSPGHAFRFLRDFLADASKAQPLCQSRLSTSWGQWLFRLSNPQAMPATPALGENIDRCMTVRIFRIITVIQALLFWHLMKKWYEVSEIVRIDCITSIIGLNKIQ